MKIIVSRDADGMTAGEFLKTKLACSARVLTRLKQHERGILQNGRRVTVRAVLHAGDTLLLATEDAPEAVSDALLPVPLPLDVIYEDADIIAVNKPDGMPTHPSRGHQDDTLANALAARFSAAGTPFVFRAVNRLDRNTTGIVVVARHQLAAARLSAAMAAGEIRKTYLAVTDGIPVPAAGRVTADIRRCAESIITREALPAGTGGATAQNAVTDYEVLSAGEGRAAVLVRPLTGRTHQIRVHFAFLGTPLLGDDLYGRASPLFPHQALHALALELPTEKGRLRLVAPPPAAFAALAGVDAQVLCAQLSPNEPERQEFR